VRDLAGKPAGSGSETTLASVLGRRVSFGEVACAVSGAFGCDLTEAGTTVPPPPGLTAAFRDPAWTWRR